MGQPEAINEALAGQYPQARAELDFRSPFELLIATVLSAQSTDRRVNSVTPELFRRYPTPLDLAGAEASDVEAIIQPVGFYRNKTTAIIGLSRRLVDQFDGAVPATLDELVTLPGVGRKTANVVLGNAFGVPGITPDTHLIRLANRFGWVDNTKPDTVERAVGALFPPSEWVMVCHRVIWHGRRCCHARRPACGACVIYDLCPSRDIGEQDRVKAAALIREPRA
ncbi:DNA-(apurinic or apyrimidinic site) lyase /endonuclease III [Tessaracoccus bendigoensis DSM 12906]|uniref:Endonuclease III n=1 Tax=Tessaracoccus bendigoensis DSM 12906 TaxID=1123357 RepID=A0A1M6HK91_9ACTN|nr:endonuclease III [Tessaracoccus bendigoensis]SHJ22614.1 DNA-(apurinic or apyrimidinic site) lyase /endonuclease III [Tessaracoccus bendigoensis DSM 12906]